MCGITPPIIELIEKEIIARLIKQIAPNLSDSGKKVLEEIVEKKQ